MQQNLVTFDLVIPYHNIQVHQRECEEVLEQCPNKCGERVPRKDVSVIKNLAIYYTEQANTVMDPTVDQTHSYCVHPSSEVL